MARRVAIEKVERQSDESVAGSGKSTIQEQIDDLQALLGRNKRMVRWSMAGCAGAMVLLSAAVIFGLQARADRVWMAGLSKSQGDWRVAVAPITNTKADWERVTVLVVLELPPTERNLDLVRQQEKWQGEAEEALRSENVFVSKHGGSVLLVEPDMVSGDDLLMAKMTLVAADRRKVVWHTRGSQSSYGGWTGPLKEAVMKGKKGLLPAGTWDLRADIGDKDE